MAMTSVAQFAGELKVPPSVLLEQLRAAGVDKRAADDSLTEADKARLLEYLRKSHGSASTPLARLVRGGVTPVVSTELTNNSDNANDVLIERRQLLRRHPQL